MVFGSKNVLDDSAWDSRVKCKLAITSSLSGRSGSPSHTFQVGRRVRCDGTSAIGSNISTSVCLLQGQVMFCSGSAGGSIGVRVGRSLSSHESSSISLICASTSTDLSGQPIPFGLTCDDCEDE